MRGLVVVLVWSFLVCSVTPVDYVGSWGWDFYDQSEYPFIIYDINNPGTVSESHRWFYFYMRGPQEFVYTPYGGVRSTDLVYSSLDGAYQVFKHTLPGLYNGVQLTTTFRIDDNGFASALWELSNPGSTTVSLRLSNNGFETAYGYGIGFQNYATSSGDSSISVADSWFVKYNPGGFPDNDRIIIGAFGEANVLDFFQYQYFVSRDFTEWDYYLDVPPGEQLGFMVVLGMEDPSVPNSLQYSVQKATNILSSASTLYNYITPSNHRLVSHLTPSQLINVVNWNFLSAGLGGDPHGVHFDGSEFELPNSPEVYCLYSDHVLQVNVRVGKYGFVKEVVVFDRAHAMVLNAKLEDDHPVYLLDGRPLQVPETLHQGLISTHLAPFNFKRSPLNQLSGYQESSLSVRGMVTIVGGSHNGAVGFFNVAVDRQSEEVEFPSVLQLPFHPLRDVGFSASVISDVWFDLLQQ